VAAATGPSIRLAAALLLAALLALALTLAPRAEAYVYWVNSGGEGEIDTIARASLYGRDIDESFIIDPGWDGGACGLAVDASHIYWGHIPFRGTSFPLTAIWRANLDGSGRDQTFIRDDTGPPRCEVAADATHIYFATAGGPTIGRANIDGSGVEQSFITDTGGVSDVAVDDTHIYWTSVDFNTPDARLGAIGRANLDGTGVDRRFIDTGGGTDPTGLAVDASHVYWACCGYNGTIVRANLDGTGVDPSFITGANVANDVAVDSTHVYWAAFESIGRANLDGTGVNQSFITGTKSVHIAVDELPFRFGEVKRNRKRGTAKLTVDVPGPGELNLAKTRKVKRANKRADAEGRVKLPVKPKGTAKKRLNEKGKAKVKARVTFVPDEGEPGTQTKPLKLVKRR
jgi:hypothetical protein